MSDTNILLSFEELIAQSQSMKTLKDEYDAMFTQVVSILNEMNEGWSDNLANNFVGKISSAQKGFSKIVEMLDCGENVAKEAAQSMEDINAVMARTISGTSGAFAGLFSSLGADGLSDVIGTGIDMNLIKNAWSKLGLNDGITTLKNGLSNITDGNLFKQLSNLEGELFNTDYLNQAKDILTVGGDFWDGKFNSDTIDSLTNLLDMDEISSALGFSDGTGLGIVVEGAKRIFGDGENIETISPIMIDYVENMEGVQEAFQNGDYLEAATGAFFYSIEGGAKLTADIIVDGATGAVDKFLDVTGLDDAIPWNDINDSITEATGINFAEAIPEIGRGMSEEFSHRVQETVEGIPIIVDYVSDGIDAGVEAIGEGLSEVGSTIAGWFGW